MLPKSLCSFIAAIAIVIGESSVIRRPFCGARGGGGGRGEGSVSNFPKHKPHCIGTLESGSGRGITQRRGVASMAHLPSCRPSSSSSFPPFGLRLPHLKLKA